MTRSVAAALISTLLLTACGAPAEAPRSAPDNPVEATPAETSSGCGEHASGDRPEDVVAYVPCPDDETPSGGPQRVEPQPGQLDVRPIGWQRVKGDGRRLRVLYTSGIEPCYVLDRVEVVESARRVTITLYEGRADLEEDVACIEIAVRKFTVVELEEPLGDRPVKDGAKS
jgi:hypothetical protein